MPDTAHRPRPDAWMAVCLASALLAPIAHADRAPPPGPPDANVEARERDPSSLETLLLGRVVSRLSESAALSDAHLRVDVEGRTVRLEGVVSSETDRTRAVRRARATRGVVRVEDRLRIEAGATAGLAARELDDGALAEDLAHRIVDDVFRDAQARRVWDFGWEIDGAAWEFDVEVDEGDVTLTGTVPWAESIPDIVQLVRSVPGVRSVRNDLQMDVDYRPPDLDGWVFRHPRP